MIRETLEELRERLLREQSVQQMIQVRAYEIFQMRGGQPGGEAHDWFNAEGEVLAFLIAHESARADEQSEAESAGAAPASHTQPVPSPTRKPRQRGAAKPAEAKAASPKKTGPKRGTSKKPETAPNAKRTRKAPTKEESGQ